MYRRPNADSGWFRVSLNTATVIHERSTDRLKRIFADKTKVFREEKTGNWVHAYNRDTEEDGVKIRLYYWIVANVVEPDLIRQAIFSYTVLFERIDDAETTRIVKLLEQIISRANFHSEIHPFLELSTGKIRFLIWTLISAGLVIGVAAVALLVFAGSADRLMPYNHFLAVVSLLVLLTVVAVPRLFCNFFVLPSRGVLISGMLLFGTEALYVNLARPLGYQTPRILNSLGFACLLVAFGYVAVQKVFANERRLLLIENELAIAREIQTPILPGSSPDLKNLHVSAAYRPMTAVAGDFYDFIPVDYNRCGFLVADVTGHGVPAALIASMTKVAMQSVVPYAHNPRQVLRGLNRNLSRQLRDQFVSAVFMARHAESQSALLSRGASTASALARRHPGAHRKQRHALRSNLRV